MDKQSDNNSKKIDRIFTLLTIIFIILFSLTLFSYSKLNKCTENKLLSDFETISKYAAKNFYNDNIKLFDESENIQKRSDIAFSKYVDYLPCSADCYLVNKNMNYISSNLQQNFNIPAEIFFYEREGNGFLNTYEIALLQEKYKKETSFSHKFVSHGVYFISNFNKIADDVWILTIIKRNQLTQSVNKYIKATYFCILILCLIIIITFIYTILEIKKNKKQIKIITKEEVEQEELEHNQNELKEALDIANASSKAKTTFLKNMSHDIRIPMNAIIGFTNLALKENNSDKTNEYLNKVNVASNHLLSLINDVLDLNRIEAGKMTINENQENLIDIISQIKNIVSTDIENNNLNFTVNYDEVIDKQIICDKLRLTQIILNILSNSIKYTPVNGNIFLKVSELEKNSFGVAKYEFKIIDNGKGISEEILNSISESILKEKTPNLSGNLNVGLGMSITKNLVTLMKGKMDISSKENFGTEVTIVIPLKTYNINEEKNQIVQEDVDFDLENLKILLVDDNDYSREIANLLLEKQKVIVTEAVNGKDALEKIFISEPGTYDVVLMDIQMPVMNGYEATKKIRSLANRNLANIPIIAMTADAFEEDKNACLESGMNNYLSKPINLNELKKVISLILNK